MKIRAAFIALMVLPLVSPAQQSSFVLTDTNGKAHSLETHQGKWVLVNLWATWCAPCLAEMPELEALSKARSDVVVLGLEVDGQTPRRVTEFAEKLHISYPVIAGNGDLAKQFKPRGYPTSILYNPAGKRVFTKEGKTTHQEIETVLQRADTH